MNSQPTVQSPRSLAEAYGLLAERGHSMKIIAGGTDLMVLMNAHQLDNSEFLDIWRIDELRGIAEEGSLLRIGALTTYSQLIGSELVQRFAPSLIAASRTIGAIQIQNRGTIGGNIVNASPAGDTLPVLAAYESQVEIGSSRGKAVVPFNEFYHGYRKTRLDPDQLVLSVLVPKLGEGENDFFWKVGTRRAQAISKTMVAAKAATRARLIDKIRIGIGSVAPTVIRAYQTERLLNGALLDDDLIEQARRMVANEIAPITDLRSTERYRRTVTANVLVKFLRQLRG
jgi:CO/xanthine dehydrogenase FAD-binding subunit